MRKTPLQGFTLIELLIVLAIFAVIMVGFLGTFLSIINIQTHQSSQALVAQEGQFLLQQISYYAETARLIDMPLDTTTSTLQLREFPTSAQDPYYIYASGGVVYLVTGTSTPTPLTSSKVTVSQLSFTRHYNIGGASDAFGADSVSFSFVMSANTTSQTQSYSQAYRASAVVFTPVPKIARIQEVSSVPVFLVPGASVSLTFPTNNEPGDLLVAVVMDGNTQAIPSITDTANNTWALEVASTDSTNNEKNRIFAAVNAAGAANTVTAVNNTAANDWLTMAIFEYRGASTSSSFDASSWQDQTSTLNPSSGLANAAGSVELIFGITRNFTTANTPAAGLGFTTETSWSSIPFYAGIEDMVQYITGPVAATWSVPGLANTNSEMATFQ